MRVTLFALVACVVLVACSSMPSRLSHATLRVEILGPQDDLGVARIPQIALTSSVELGKTSVIGAPPGYAVVCAPERTSCKHAATKLTIRASICEDSSGTNSVCGSGTWEYGRRVVYRDAMTRMSMTVPERVPLLDQGQTTKSFRVQIGSSEVVHGPFGAQFAISASK
jgi:hypothetical protein